MTKSLEKIWHGKWKILGISIVYFSILYSFVDINTSPEFLAKTEVKPISNKDELRFWHLNSSQQLVIYKQRPADISGNAGMAIMLNEVNEQVSEKIERRVTVADSFTEETKLRFGNNPGYPVFLNELFLEQIENKELILSLFKKYDLVLREDFDDTGEYEERLWELLSGLSLLAPVNKGGLTRGLRRENWIIRFRFDDREKWLAVLSELETRANENIRVFLISQFENLMAFKKLKHRNAIEDLNDRRKILIESHKKEIGKRIKFLTEQADIARVIDLPKQKLVQLNVQQMATNNLDENLFPLGSLTYLRGYLAIEEEIKILQTQQDQELFVKGLNSLDQEIQMLSLKFKKEVERARELFQATPLFDPDGFAAMSIKHETTEFEIISGLIRKLALLILVSSIAGILTILITDAISRNSRSA